MFHLKAFLNIFTHDKFEKLMKFSAFLLLFLLLLSYSNLFAIDTNKIDSLKQVLVNANEKDKAEILFKISSFYCDFYADSAIIYGKNSIDIARKYKQTKIEANANKILATAYFYKGNSSNAKASFSIALDLFEQIHDTIGMANCYNGLGIIANSIGDFYSASDIFSKMLDLSLKAKMEDEASNAYNNLGVVYERLGKYDKSIENYQKGLSIREKNNNIRSIADSYNNIGNVYYYSAVSGKIYENFTKAIQNYDKAKEAYSKSSDQLGVAKILGNIANIFLEETAKEKDYNKALEYNLEALKIKQKINNKASLAYSIHNTGNCYLLLKDYNKALYYFSDALNIRQEIDDKIGEAYTLQKIADLYVEKNNISKAIEFLSKAKDIASSMNAFDNIINIEESYYEAYKKGKNFELALEHYQNMNILKDSIYNIENNKIISELDVKYETEKKEKELILERSENQNNLLIIKQQKTQMYFFIGVIVLFFLLGIVILKAYRDKRKANQKLEIKNKVIQEQAEQLLKTNEEINDQKKLVEFKNTEITDSIHYAGRIQNAILPKIDFLNEIFPEHLIIFKPRDIVSGDFYWAAKVDNNVIFTVGDCTGHGVPGAFMSLLGLSFLNEIVTKNKLVETDKILNHLRNSVISALHQTGTFGEAQDGMDIAMCNYNTENSIITFSGANNPIIIVKKNSELIELKPDKMPIGIYYGNETRDFTATTFQLEKSDMIYIFSDGYADQFGGEKGKKFKYHRFKQLLIESSSFPVDIQKQKIEGTLEKWIGCHEQVDDICLLGIKI